MIVSVRLATTSDVHALALLLGAYMLETFRVPWAGSAAALEASMCEGALSMLVAHAGDRAVGFAAMVPDFDLHHCVRGLRVVDLYATPDVRARAVGARLIAHVAAVAIDRGLVYVRGEAVESRATRRLFARVAVRFGDTYNVSDPALTLLASLRESTPREMLRAIATLTGR